MTFNEKMLSIARKRRMLNRKGFALLAGVTPHTVSRCEMGLTTPTPENVETFARVLGFPVAFFYHQTVEEPSAESVSFRSQTAMTAAVRDAALAAGAVGFLVSDWVESRFDLPPVALPDLQFFKPEDAARALREHWSLGERPISNMVHLVESKGVRIFSLCEESKRVNAFSVWRDDKPYIFLNTMKSAESSRFDAAHELGHLVLHQDGRTTGRSAEDEANLFASAFLMPRADVVARLPEIYSLEQIMRAKARWKVSLAALNYRLHKVGATSDWKYRDMCIQIMRSRYNVEEPYPIDRERSMVWEKVLRLLWQDRKTFKHIADELHLPDSEVSALVFGVLSASETPPDRQDSGVSLVSI